MDKWRRQIVYSKDQLMHMKRKILIRIADYFNIKGISGWNKEEIVDAILSTIKSQEPTNEDVQMSVRIRRIKQQEK